MTTQSNNWDASTVIATSSLQGLADGSLWQSEQFVSSADAIDVTVNIETTTTSGDGDQVQILFGHSTNSGFLPSGLSGSEGAYSPVANQDQALKTARIMYINANEGTARVHRDSFRRIGLSEHFAWAVKNDTGTALGVNSNSIEMKFLYRDQN